MSITIRARSISEGVGTGEILVSHEPISFLSGVDPETGTVVEAGHPLEGISLGGKVLVFPYGKGSTVGSYVMYALQRNGKAPVAIINLDAEPIIAVGAIMAGIPMVDRPEGSIMDLDDGTVVTVDGSSGEITCESSD
jgi:predicted aconitase with swiveling domain